MRSRIINNLYKGSFFNGNPSNMKKIDYKNKKLIIKESNDNSKIKKTINHSSITNKTTINPSIDKVIESEKIKIKLNVEEDNKFGFGTYFERKLKEIIDNISNDEVIIKNTKKMYEIKECERLLEIINDSDNENINQNDKKENSINEDIKKIKDGRDEISKKFNQDMPFNYNRSNNICDNIEQNIENKEFPIYINDNKYNNIINNEKISKQLNNKVAATLPNGQIIYLNPQNIYKDIELNKNNENSDVDDVINIFKNNIDTSSLIEEQQINNMNYQYIIPINNIDNNYNINKTNNFNHIH